MSGEYLFVYGTLRSDARHPMHAWLRREAVPAGAAHFAGRLFDLGSYPGAVPDNSGHWLIRGELYHMPRPAPLLERLDAYEGCGPRNRPPHAYRRERRPVQAEDGTERHAWIYLYNLPVDGARQIESGDFMARRETG